MKKRITILLAAAVFLTMAGCGQKAEKAPTSELDAIGVYRPDVDSSRSAIQEWIAGLDLDI